MGKFFKRIFITLLTACVLFFCVGCSINTKAIVKDINENTNLEIGLLTRVEDGLFDEKYDTIPGFGITGYFDKKYGDNYQENSDAIDACSVIYHVTSYPDVILGKECVTGIAVTDPLIQVYGFSVGDSVAEMETFLLDNGYKNFDDANRLKKFKKGKVQIRIGINYEEQKIRSIYVGVDSTNITCAIF